jgi:hypothetical protein
MCGCSKSWSIGKNLITCSVCKTSFRVSGFAAPEDFNRLRSQLIKIPESIDIKQGSSQVKRNQNEIEKEENQK